MAKNRDKLDMPTLEVEPAKTPESNKKAEKKSGGRPSNAKGKKKFSLARLFREMISELKKVEWAPFRKTKNNAGVLSQTGTVLVVVLFFLVVISLFDTGLGKLLELLLKAASPAA